jgi:hypothetical protein
LDCQPRSLKQIIEYCAPFLRKSILHPFALIVRIYLAALEANNEIDRLFIMLRSNAVMRPKAQHLYVLLADVPVESETQVLDLLT